MGAINYKLDAASRAALIKRFPPQFSEVKCDHVTVIFGVGKDTALPAAPRTLEVVAYACDGSGIECLVVEADGSSVRHKDSGTLHITLSRNADRASRQSNDLLKNGWERLDKPITFTATVAFEPD